MSNDINWDQAFANAPFIPDGEKYAAHWAGEAEAYRQSLIVSDQIKVDVPYGQHARERMDLIRPLGKPKGLMFFVHGGFWRAFDKSFWTHFAKGALYHDYLVVIPNFSLCPEIRLSSIPNQITTAIESAAQIIKEGPIFLIGHGSGGQMVSRMICADSPLSIQTQSRIAKVLSISGIHDLRPLLNTVINQELQLDLSEARRESPALLEPIPNTELVCWVGGDERPEFLRQSELLANIWHGRGVQTAEVILPGLHHFNVIDKLQSHRGDFLDFVQL